MQCLILVFIFWVGKATQNFESKKPLLISIGKQKPSFHRCLHVKQPAVWQRVGFQQIVIFLYPFPPFPIWGGC